MSSAVDPRSALILASAARDGVRHDLIMAEAILASTEIDSEAAREAHLAVDRARTALEEVSAIWNQRFAAVVDAAHDAPSLTAVLASLSTSALLAA